MTKKTIPAKSKPMPPAKPFPHWVSDLLFALTLLVIPFITSKIILDHALMPRLLALTVVLAVYLLILLLFRKLPMPELQMTMRLPTLIWLLFTLSGAISLIWATNQGEGVAVIVKDLLFLLVFILFAGALLRSPNRRNLFTIVLLLMSALTIIGLFQYFDFAFRSPSFDELYKVKALMSHKNIFAGTLFLGIPFLAYEALFAQNARKWLFSISLFLLLLLIMLLQTRAIWLSCAGFVGIAGIVIPFLIRKKQAGSDAKHLRKGFLLTGLIFVLAFGMGWFTIDYSAKNPRKMPVKRGAAGVVTAEERISSVIDTESQNARRRLEIWEITGRMIKDHPVTGVGAGNWKIIVPEYYYEGYVTTFYHNWRRPHNDFLWAASERGIVGGLLYLAFFGFLAFCFVRVLLSKAGIRSKIFVLFCFAGLAGYVADAFFSFPYERVEQQLLFMLLAAGVVAPYYTAVVRNSPRILPGRKFFLLTALLLLVPAFLVFNRIFRAEKFVNIAFSELKAGRFSNVVEAIDIAYTPLFTVDAMNVPLYWFRGQAHMSKEQYQQAVADYEIALKHSPNSIMVYADMGAAYGRLEKHETALEYFLKAYNTFPANADMLKNLGAAYYHIRDYDKSIEFFNRYNEVRPDTTITGIIEGIQLEKQRFLSDSLKN